MTPIKLAAEAPAPAALVPAEAIVVRNDPTRIAMTKRNTANATSTMAPGGMSGRRLPLILALGTTQTLAWASSYYLPAILADPIARDLSISSNWVFAAFSASVQPWMLTMPYSVQT